MTGSTGPKLDALETIRVLVEGYLEGRSELDGKQLLECIATVIAPFERPIQPKDVRASLTRMQELVAQGDYEQAHHEQMAAYEGVLGYFAEGGEELARLALQAKNIVTRWE